MRLILGRFGPAAAQRALGRYWRDLRGATLVQFIAVLPMFIFLVYGAWAVSEVMGAHATLCEAAHESARYLQVEGPRFPDDDPNYGYPDGWRRVAFGIAKEELAAHRRLRESTFTEDKVTIWPSAKPSSPEGPDQVSPEQVVNSLFTVRVDASIPNPMLLWFDGVGAGGGLDLKCQATGFFEGAPFRATVDDPASGDACERERRRNPDCRRPPRCPPGGPPTVCPDCTPVCCPCEERP